MEPTWLTILPAVVTIVAAFATRQVVFALFAGVLTGSAVLLIQAAAQNVAGVDANPLTRFLMPAIGSERFAQILLIYLWCLGGLIGVWSKTGGAAHFARTVGHRVARGPRTSLLFAWIVGVVFHQGGTVSTVLAGTTVKPVTDRHRVSHEELSYVVDSTASPVATVIPFNAWPAYVATFAAGSVPFLPAADTVRAQEFFIESIAFNFYGVLAVLGTLLFALGWMPFVFPRMRRAIERARTTGALDADDAQPMLPPDDDISDAEPGYRPSLWDFFVPMAVLLGVAIGPYTLAKLGVIDDGNWINEAFCLCVLSAMALAVLRGMRLGVVLEGFIEGCQRMTIGAIVLGLAVTLGKVATELGTAEWVAATVGDAVPPLALPALLTALCMGIAFATGSSWGTYAVVVPIALPLAWAMSPDATYVSICFGAVIGGSVFGDQCSPISDTTILSSMFTGCDLMDHVRTQLPPAMTFAGLGVVASTACAAVLAAPTRLEPFTQTVDGTEISFTMVPIPGGTFVMGGPGGDEAPQREVAISPFWIGEHEVTWDEYEQWMLDLERDRRPAGAVVGKADARADAVARPTPPYTDMTFGMGHDGFPAICMTQLAAETYCEWLSAKTGRNYRLPTEAEWEYACRAGTTTAWSCGDDVAALDAHAWHAGNSDGRYHRVGRKLPNPWGLHDMHGNVAEWVQDAHAPYVPHAGPAPLADPVVEATALYPRVVRGGSWADPPERLRSAARRGSHPDWKRRDPQLPQSVWYHTDASFVGFRVACEP